MSSSWPIFRPYVGLRSIVWDWEGYWRIDLDELYLENDDHVDIDDIIHFADMDETYATYVDDVYADNHDYDDDTDDDT